ncbi:MAG: MFS transporter [Patescibacteria group bacterium]
MAPNIDLMYHILRHFYQLSEKARVLLLSFVCYSAVIPILSIFLNTYILRFSNNFSLLILYYGFFFCTIPLGFLLNGLLLRRFAVTVLYGCGLILFVVSNSSIVFLHNLSVPGIALFGFLYGIGTGVYWGNRNLLTLAETESDTRVFFNSLELITGILLTIIIPGMAGWFISLGEISGLYSIRAAYVILMFLSVVLVLLSSVFVFKIHFKKINVPHLFVDHVTPAWWVARLITLSEGITNGVAFLLPTYFLFKFVGKENVIGSFDSIVALIVAALLYALGVKLTKDNRLKVAVLAYVGVALSAVIIFFFKNTNGVIVYLGLTYLLSSISYIAGHAILLDLTDRESSQFSYGSYCYVFDRETCLNIGRMIAILLMVVVVYKIIPLEYEQVPVIASVLQLSVLGTALYILNKDKVKTTL